MTTRRTAIQTPRRRYAGHGGFTLTAHQIAAIILVVALVAPVAVAGADSSAAAAGDPVLAWGDNGQEQLGPNGPESQTEDPVEVAGLDDVVQLTASEHNLALRVDGTVWSWGSDTWNQLGRGEGSTPGSGGSQPEPAPVAGPSGNGQLDGVVDVAAAREHSVALREDGTVWAWGRDNCGRLGQPSVPPGFASSEDAPVRVEQLEDIVAIDAGGAFSLALDTDGTLWTWGDSVASLGGTHATGCSNFPLVQMNVVGTQGQPVPVPLPEHSDVVAFAAGSAHALALTRDGLVWSWGANCEGQLGTPMAAEREGDNVGADPSPGRGLPLPVDGLPIGRVVGVAAGGVGNGGHSLALTADGQVYAWGLAEALGAGEVLATPSPCESGRRGDGHPAPVRVQRAADGTVLSGTSALTGGTGHSLATTEAGELYAWGRNEAGQLGRSGGTRLQAEQVDLAGQGDGDAGQMEAQTATVASTPEVLVAHTGADRHSVAALGSPPVRPNPELAPLPLSEVEAMVADQLARAEEAADEARENTPEDADEAAKEGEEAGEEAKTELGERLEELDEEVAALEDDVDELVGDEVNELAGDELEEFEARRAEVEAEIERLQDDLAAIRRGLEEGDQRAVLDRLDARLDELATRVQDEVPEEDAPPPPFEGDDPSVDGDGGRLFVTGRPTDYEAGRRDSGAPPDPEAIRHHLARMVAYVTPGEEAPRLLYVTSSPPVAYYDGQNAPAQGLEDAGFSRCSSDQAEPSGDGCFEIAYTRRQYGQDEGEWADHARRLEDVDQFVAYDAVVFGHQAVNRQEGGDLDARRQELYEYVNEDKGGWLYLDVATTSPLASWLDPQTYAFESPMRHGPFTVTEWGRQLGLTERGANAHHTNGWFGDPQGCVMERQSATGDAISLGARAPIQDPPETCDEQELPEENGVPPLPERHDGEDPTEGLPGGNPPNPHVQVNLPNQLPSVNLNPGGSPGGAPGGSPGGAPGGSPGGAPGGSPGGAPGSAPGSAPGTAPGTAPGFAPGTAPGSAPGTAPGSATGQAPGSATGSAPAPTVAQAPGGAGAPGPSVAPAPGAGSAAPGTALAQGGVMPPATAPGQAPGGASQAPGSAEAGGERHRQLRVEVEEAPVEASDTEPEAGGESASKGDRDGQQPGEFKASSRQSSPVVPFGAAAVALAAGVALGWHTRRTPTGGEPACVRVPASTGPPDDLPGESSEEWLAWRRDQR